jgi:hypothetical protein
MRYAQRASAHFGPPCTSTGTKFTSAPALGSR